MRSHHDPVTLERARRLAAELPNSVDEVYTALIAGATDAQVRALAGVQAAGMIPRNECGERGTIADALRMLRATDSLTLARGVR